jgi:hypothetical protein
MVSANSFRRDRSTGYTVDPVMKGADGVLSSASWICTISGPLLEEREAKRGHRPPSGLTKQFG